MLLPSGRWNSHNILILCDGRCFSQWQMEWPLPLKISAKKLRQYHKKGEKALLNERIRMVNNTITMFEIQIGMCMNQLKGILDKETMEECMVFIKLKRESRHIKTQKTQVLKFN